MRRTQRWICKMGCSCHCGCEEKNKMVKVYFCPRCGGKDVAFVFRLKNAFGILPKMECKKCNFSGNIFPLLVVDKESLNKENKKVDKKNKVKKNE